MEDREYLIILYDYYGELFNDNQKKLFEEYYFDNLSLSEIAENEGKSRNAIHKMIKSICTKLYFYEEKLKIYDKDLNIKNIIKSIDDEKIKDRLGELLWTTDYQ